MEIIKPISSFRHINYASMTCLAFSKLHWEHQLLLDIEKEEFLYLSVMIMQCKLTLTQILSPKQLCHNKVKMPQ